MIKVILGPPGTGKTKTLIDICKEAINSGVSPKKIGFISFTKKAAIEAIGRATQEIANEKDLPYFRTIHSLAFWSLRLQRDQVFNNKQLSKFARQHGYQFTTKATFAEDGTFSGRTDDDRAFFLINLARNKTLELETMRDEVIVLDVEMNYILTMKENYFKFLKEEHLTDFTEMLEQYHLHTNYPQLDLLCVDEAQDLSTLQWLIVARLMNKAKQTFIAGDDDQAIYEWSGANVKMFQDYAETCPTQILNQTYRFGQEISQISRQIIIKCSKRIQKEFKPKNNQSSVMRLSDISSLPTRKDTLILARSFYLLKEVVEQFEDDGVDWSFITDNKTTPVKIGTIHSVKGGEAANVALLSDVSQTTYEQINSDQEHRVWYTGATRAKENLYIVEPRTEFYYDV